MLARVSFPVKEEAILRHFKEEAFYRCKGKKDKQLPNYHKFQQLLSSKLIQQLKIKIIISIKKNVKNLLIKRRYSTACLMS